MIMGAIQQVVIYSIQTAVNMRPSLMKAVFYSFACANMLVIGLKFISILAIPLGNRAWSTAYRSYRCIHKKVILKAWLWCTGKLALSFINTPILVVKRSLCFKVALKMSMAVTPLAVGSVGHT